MPPHHPDNNVMVWGLGRRLTAGAGPELHRVIDIQEQKGFWLWISESRMRVSGFRVSGSAFGFRFSGVGLGV